MKKFIVSMFVIGGIAFASPAFADETPTPIACAVDSEGNETCEDIPVVDTTDAPVDEPLPPVCTEEDMSACQRGEILYKESMPMVADTSAVHTENHEHETWWDIFTDRNHIFAELGWTIIQDVIVLWLLYGIVFKKWLLPRLTRRIHEDIDKEHGIEHG